MAKYLQRPCPKCNGCLGIVVSERKQTINGRCLYGLRERWFYENVQSFEICLKCCRFDLIVDLSIISHIDIMLISF